MKFPLGKPMLVMVALAVLSGAAVALRPAERGADVTVWVRTATHQRILGDVAERSGGSSAVDVKLISGRSMDVRLVSLFMSDARDERLPDLAEVEISNVGKYFRPPVDRIGFLPLNEFLERSGWDRGIVASRFAPWSKQDQIFGVPFDVHPVAITYRHDLFAQAGVDPSTARTWAEFQSLCLRYQEYWRSRGEPRRYAIELPRASADYLVVMLLQRGINLLDDDSRVHLTHPNVAKTIAFYARCVAGPGRIGDNASSGPGVWTRDLEQGHIAAFITPDWRLDDIRSYAPSLRGKLRVMPLPRFEPTDAPTSTWGGTMLGIPRHARDPQRSWEVLERLYLSDQSLAARQRFTKILPPVVTQWADPQYHRRDPFFGGQRVDELFIALAAQIPPRFVTPFTAIATTHLSAVLTKAVAHVEARGTDDLEDLCNRWLAEAALDLQRRIEFGTFD